MLKYRYIFKDKNSNAYLFFYLLIFFLLSRCSYILVGEIYNLIKNTNNNFFSLINQYDSGWYNTIIDKGYDIEPSGNPAKNAANWAFFPLYPMAVSCFKAIFHNLATNQAGPICSNIFIIVSVIFTSKYYKLTRQEGNFLIPMFLMFLGPYSFYFSATYTESLFVMLVSINFYFIKTKKYILAGFIAALASATRNTGAFLVVPLLLNMFFDEYTKINIVNIKNYIIKIFVEPKKLLSILLCPLGIFSYMAYLYFKVGDVWAFAHIQLGWGRENKIFIPNLIKSLLGYNGGEGIYLAVVVILGFYVYLKLILNKRYDEALFGIIVTIIPLFSSLYSMPRYFLGSYFAILGLSDIIGHSRRKWIFISLGFVIELLLLFFWYSSKFFLI